VQHCVTKNVPGNVPGVILNYLTIVVLNFILENYRIRKMAS